MTSLILFGKLKRRETNLDPIKLSAPTTTILSDVLFDLQSLSWSRLCLLAWSSDGHRWEEAEVNWISLSSKCVHVSVCVCV